MRELFVYYRVRSVDADAVRIAVQGLQTTLMSQHAGLNSRLLRRPEQVGGLETWMETYAMEPLRAPEGIGEALQAEIARQASPLLQLLAGPRHTEVFIACAS